MFEYSSEMTRSTHRRQKGAVNHGYPLIHGSFYCSPGHRTLFSDVLSGVICYFLLLRRLLIRAAATANRATPASPS